jgi:transposase
MKLYAGIDLHSNNSLVSVIDETDRVLVERRVPNELQQIVRVLEPYRQRMTGVAVESTYNWYWLVDGLMECGFTVHLANPAAMKQYEGLKRTDDAHDAWWLAHLLRLGILPRGYIYPKEERAVRDLLRKRMQLVRVRSMQILSVQNLVARNTGGKISGNAVKQLSAQGVDKVASEPLHALAIEANVRVMDCAQEQVERLEREILIRARPRPEFALLKSVSGVGDILGLTILLETGEIGRFAKVGCYASYARCVDSARISNRKKKGEGNAKCGNRYLAWAFVEAAHFAVRYEPRIRRFFERKRARRGAMVAIKAVAHKLARAVYHVLSRKVAFDLKRAFA